MIIMLIKITVNPCRISALGSIGLLFGGDIRSVSDQ